MSNESLLHSVDRTIELAKRELSSQKLDEKVKTLTEQEIAELSKPTEANENDAIFKETNQMHADNKFFKMLSNSDTLCSTIDVSELEELLGKSRDSKDNMTYMEFVFMNKQFNDREHTKEVLNNFMNSADKEELEAVLDGFFAKLNLTALWENVKQTVDWDDPADSLMSFL